MSERRVQEYKRNNAVGHVRNAIGGALMETMARNGKDLLSALIAPFQGFDPTGISNMRSTSNTDTADETETKKRKIEQVKIAKQEVKYLPPGSKSIRAVPVITQRRTCNNGKQVTVRAYNNLSYATSTTSYTDQFILLNGVAQGTGLYNRVGRCINMETLDLRIALAIPQITQTTQGLFRIAIIYDRSTNTTAAGAAGGITFGDVFKTYDSAAATTSAIDATQNPDNLDRYQILYDKYINYGLSTGIAPTPTNVTMHIHPATIDESLIINQSTTYVGTGSTVANITTGALWLIVVNTLADGAALGTGPTFAYNATLKYTDN